MVADENIKNILILFSIFFSYFKLKSRPSLFKHNAIREHKEFQTICE